MENNTEDILNKLKDLEKEYNKYQAEKQFLLIEQEKVIDELIEKNRPIFEWIRNKTDFFFTHPTLNYRTRKGPVLGYQEKDDRLIIYDVESKRIKITDIGEKYNPDKTMVTFQLVRNGYFTTAVKGLTYLEEMFENYVQRLTKSIEELNKELSDV